MKENGGSRTQSSSNINIIPYVLSSWCNEKANYEQEGLQRWRVNPAQHTRPGAHVADQNWLRLGIPRVLPRVGWRHGREQQASFLPNCIW